MIRIFCYKSQFIQGVSWNSLRLSPAYICQTLPSSLSLSLFLSPPPPPPPTFFPSFSLPFFRYCFLLAPGLFLSVLFCIPFFRVFCLFVFVFFPLFVLFWFCHFLFYFLLHMKKLKHFGQKGSGEKKNQHTTCL